MNRHVCRICAMKILYTLDLNKNLDTPLEITKILEYVVDPDYDTSLDQQAEEAFVLENLPFVKQLVEGVKFNLSAIDEIIQKNIKNWTIERLSYVDRAIIRVAVYELMYTDTPSNVVIDEAIEVTKEYSNLDDDTQSKFTNRLLDSIKENLNNVR